MIIGTVLVYVLLILVLFGGAKVCRKGEWNEEYTSLNQMRVLKGGMVLLISFHHMAQKTCAPWHAPEYTVHGLDVFVPVGFLLCSVFLLCSSYGLYKSLRTRRDYLKHFMRRRVVPVVIAYYLSEIVYLVIRLLMGEKMGTVTVLWYLSGLHMANFNAWFIIAIIYLYLAFYFSFRFCKTEKDAVRWVFILTLLYTVAGAFVDHQNDWFMRGEWWYNSIILFPLGLLFAKYEEKITAFIRKKYRKWLILSAVSVPVTYGFSLLLKDAVLGYYGEQRGDPLRVLSRLGTAAGEWTACVCFVAFIFILLMKVRTGNRVLNLLGGATLEYYLMHGVFVELFGYDFLEFTKSVVYIRDLPLYIAVVLACSAAAAFLFRLLWKTVLKAPVFRVPVKE